MFQQVVETDEKIDIELLKKKEKIYFFEDVILFEDELADNGCALLNVKMVQNCLVLNLYQTTCVKKTIENIIF